MQNPNYAPDLAARLLALLSSLPEDFSAERETQVENADRVGSRDRYDANETEKESLCRAYESYGAIVQVAAATIDSLPTFAAQEPYRAIYSEALERCEVLANAVTDLANAEPDSDDASEYDVPCECDFGPPYVRECPRNNDDDVYLEVRADEEPVTFLPDIEHEHAVSVVGSLLAALPIDSGDVFFANGNAVRRTRTGDYRVVVGGLDLSYEPARVLDLARFILA